MPALVPRASISTSGSEGAWWTQFTSELAADGRHSSGALAELDRVAAASMHRVPTLGEVAWLHSRVRKGLLVGGVQAGKTTAMMAVAARALDRGFRIIVVLAGLRDDLRRQTALRFGRYLLARGERLFANKAGRWQPSMPPVYSHPRGRGAHGRQSSCWAAGYLTDCNQDDSFVSGFRDALLAGRSVLVVAKKNTRSLDRLGAAIRGAIEDRGAASVPLLVLDDECDEASVGADEFAPTPDAIARLWDHAGLATVYLGVTATPAASLLQSKKNSLYPSDFVVVLRVPGAEDTSTSYFEGRWSSRYTGGRTFFQALEDAGRSNFLIERALSDGEVDGMQCAAQGLEEALIAYFVGGAMRLLEGAGASLVGESGQVPAPHTMLLHTDSEIEQHWELCRRIMSICGRQAGTGTETIGEIRRLSPESRLSASGLEAWLERDEVRWRNWYERLEVAKESVRHLSPETYQASTPEWGVVRTRLREVFAGTKLRVLNSDELSSEPALDFLGGYSDGVRQQPYDVYSIIIGGNRLSRGLTIEGLCVSYYSRAPGLVAEDTATQRERWFGYRGDFLPYVRVFCSPKTAWNLTRFYLHEEDVRDQLVALLDSGASPSHANYRFLRLSHSVPTSKLDPSQLGALSFSGTRMFLDRAEVSVEPHSLTLASENLEITRKLVQDVMGGGGPCKTKASSAVIGHVLRDQSAERVVAFLEALRLSFHNPDSSEGVRVNLSRWHKPTDPDRPRRDGVLSATADPYLLAAYLRFWDAAYRACEQRRLANPYLSSSDTGTSWTPCPVPRFNIGVRFGMMSSRADLHDKVPLANKRIGPDGALATTWGGRSPSGDYPGDVAFDYADGSVSGVRPYGTPGLLLLYVVDRDARGLDGDGTTYPLDRPLLGCVVPAGGPNVLFATPPKEES